MRVSVELSVSHLTLKVAMRNGGVVFAAPQSARQSVMQSAMQEFSRVPVRRARGGSDVSLSHARRRGLTGSGKRARRDDEGFMARALSPIRKR